MITDNRVDVAIISCRRPRTHNKRQTDARGKIAATPSAAFSDQFFGKNKAKAIVKYFDAI
jgi:hypothetical protein